MTRSILAALSVVTSAMLLTNQGCKSTGVGDPCTPEQEYDVAFSGFSEKEVNVESKSFQCQTRLCLVNHFRGRVSCPYGQDSTGQPAAPDQDDRPCLLPSDANLTKAEVDAFSEEERKDHVIQPVQPDPLGACVAAQCEDRTADKAVYCSCRCANLDGRTDDGAVYCECPEGFACTPLVSSIGPGSDEGLTGSYCVRSGTEYLPSGNPCSNSLDGQPTRCVN